MVRVTVEDAQIQMMLNSMFDALKLESNYAEDFSKWLNQAHAAIRAKSDQDQIHITQAGMQAQAHRAGINFMDMKQYFKNSPNVRHKKDGGWYLIIPMHQKASQLKSIAPRSLWNQLSSMDFGSTGEMTKDGVNLLQQGLGQDQSNVITPLKYQWKSSNITRVAPKTGGKRGHYIAFRTVSDKSDPNSWIVGRQAFTNQNTSQMQAHDIASTLQKLYADYQRKG